MKELVEIQSRLKAPKSNYNSFGKYKYRSCEDILSAVKPLLHEYNCHLTISDEIVELAGRVYVKATATLETHDKSSRVTTSAYAREDDSKKGMDGSQVTGASSSYARKYALNGLFAIDDTKDADALNTSEAYTEKQPAGWEKEIESANTKEELLAVHTAHPELHQNKLFLGALSERKKKLTR